MTHLKICFFCLFFDPIRARGASEFAKSAIMINKYLFSKKFNKSIIKFKIDVDSRYVEKQKCSLEKNYWVENVVSSKKSQKLHSKSASNSAFLILKLNFC
jgi:hypothetical protein